MDTKINKENHKETDTHSKAGHNNTQTVLTAAGASMAGSASGTSGAMAYAENLRPHHLDYDDYDDEEEEEEGNEGHEGGEDNDGNEGHEGHEGHEPEGGNEGNDFEEGSEGGTTGETEEIEPQGDGGNDFDGNSGGELTENTEGGEPIENIDNVLPDDIAQELASEVDDNDRDINATFDVTAIETQYDQEGNEMQVAMVQTADGGQFMLVDVDNDFTFDVVTDLAGNPVAQVEGGLTMSDVEEMLDDSGGYLTSEEEVSLASNDISEVDVVNTDGTGLDLAALDETDIEQGLDPLLMDEGFESIDPTDIDSDMYDA